MPEKVFAVWLDDEHRAALKRAAQSLGTSRADTIRVIIRAVDQELAKLPRNTITIGQSPRSRQSRESTMTKRVTEAANASRK